MAKKRTAAATSAGSPSRPIGILAWSRACVSFGKSCGSSTAHGARTQPLDVGHRLAGRRGGAMVVDGDVEADARQLERDGAAEADGTSRHQRGLSGRLFDLFQPLWCHDLTMSGTLRNWIKVRFITGFFVTVPAVATAWLLYVFWDAIDKFFSPGYERIFGQRVPGLGFMTAVLLILFMGTLATNVVGRRILARVERLFIRGASPRRSYPTERACRRRSGPRPR